MQFQPTIIKLSEESNHFLVWKVGNIQEKREDLSTVHPQKQKQLAHTARVHQKQFHCLFLSQPGNPGISLHFPSFLIILVCICTDCYWYTRDFPPVSPEQIRYKALLQTLTARGKWNNVESCTINAKI